MIVENLRQFGLNEKEISVYLSLISLGRSPVRLVAKEAKVNRGTTYDILKNLVELGLVSYYKDYGKEDKRQYFVAEPPRKLLDAIENKKRNLETVEEQIAKALPELESIYEKSGARPTVKYYEGNAGVRTVLQDVLGTTAKATEKIYYAYSSADIREYLYKAYPRYSDDRIKQKIRVQVIAVGKGGELVGLDERKWLSHKDPSRLREDEAGSAPTYVLIYSGKVAMISVDLTKQPVGVIVEDQGLYQTQKMVFQKLWDTL